LSVTIPALGVGGKLMELPLPSEIVEAASTTIPDSRLTVGQDRAKAQAIIKKRLHEFHFPQAQTVIREDVCVPKVTTYPLRNSFESQAAALLVEDMVERGVLQPVNPHEYGDYHRTFWNPMFLVPKKGNTGVTRTLSREEARKLFRVVVDVRAANRATPSPEGAWGSHMPPVETVLGNIP
ncbi:hypothetical protein FOZ62_020813, partial [Perkinsus olseni]